MPLIKYIKIKKSQTSKDDLGFHTNQPKNYDFTSKSQARLSTM